MTQTIITIIAFCLINLNAIAQMSSIQTSTQNAIQGKFKTFIILDENTGFVLAKKPSQYQPDNKMPLSYFTVLLPDGVTGYVPGVPRSFIIHTLQTVTGLSEQDWVLENNLEEESVFFARSKYVNNKSSKQWLIKIDGEKIVFQNLRTNCFLFIDKNGKYYMVDNFINATRWKLIYTY